MEKELSEISKFVESYWNYYLELEDAFKQTQKYVAFDRHNDHTYSVEYLKMIQTVCRAYLKTKKCTKDCYVLY